MRTQVAIFFSLLFAVARSDAVDIETPKNQPVEITSTGETRYENGVAIARDNVAIHVGDTDIYADSARYDSQRHEISAEGHVRIYREDKLTIAEHGTYNLDTKEIHAETVRSSSDPYFVNGEKFVNFSDGHSVVENGDFTTDDSSNPDFHFHAHKVRVYENDRVVFQNVTFYVGKVPVFWWPYLYQSLNDAFTAGWLASASRHEIVTFPDRSERNTTRLPSGVHSGRTFAPSVVSCVNVLRGMS